MPGPSRESVNLLSDPLAIGEVDGADLPAERILAHKAFPHQKLDEGPLHNPIRGICRAHHERASWIGGHPSWWYNLPIRDLDALGCAVVGHQSRYGLQSNRLVLSTEPSSRTTILGRLFRQLPKPA
jgi:hypothetical protein